MFSFLSYLDTFQGFQVSKYYSSEVTMNHQLFTNLSNHFLPPLTVEMCLEYLDYALLVKE